MSRVVIAVILLFVASSLSAGDKLPPDYWTGPSSSYTGVTDTYTFNNGNVYLGITFYVTKGSIVSQSQSGTTYSVQIQWHTVGTGTIEIDYDTDIFLGTKSVSIQGVNAPATTFTQTFPLCGTTTVTRNSSPGGSTWYWQTYTTGMDMSNSGPSVTVTSTSPRYLRARMNTSPYAWSVATTTGNITIQTPPPAPATATNGNLISNTGGSVPLSVSAVSGATSYKWYYVQSGGSQIAGSSTTTSYTPVTPATATYYVEAILGMCISTTRKAVTANVHPEPVISTEDGTVNMGAQAELKVLNHTYDSYQWNNSGTGIPVSGATAATFTTSTAGNYTVRVTKGNAPQYTTTPFAVTSGLSPLNMNYVISNTVLVSGITLETQLAGLPVEQKSQTIQYFDGLGAPMQTVITQGSPLKKDIVQQMVYDGFGREHRKYLPVVVNKVSGWYKSGILNARGAYSTIAESFYQNNPTAKIAQDTMPYTHTVFEASSVNRPLEDFGSGSQWTVNNKRIRYKYRVNTHSTNANDTAEKVIAWKVEGNLPQRMSAATGLVVTNGYYANSQLSIKVVIDEEGNSVREYTNKLGQVILKKVQATAAGINNLNDLIGLTPGWALTYYVYDLKGNLRFVLPPELSKIIHQNDTYNPTTTDLNNWAFRYTYDLRKRMATKKVPGAGTVFMVYDKRDRLVATQDSSQRTGAAKYWSFTKYDQLNRPIMTGIKDTTAVTQAQMQAAVDAWYDPATPWRKYGEKFVGNIAGNVHGYTNTSYPKTTSPAALDANRYLSVSYYDSYGFKALMGDSSAYSFQAAHLAGQKTLIHKRITGQVSGTKIKVLDGGVTGGYTWLSTVNYYDDDYRLTQTVSDNYKSGTDRITNTYDFSGKVLKTKSTHAESDVTWKDLVSVQLKGNTLTGTTVASGAASVQQLAAGQNGSLEVIYTEGNTTRFIGLNDANPDVSAANINYAFRFTATNTANVYENNTVKATISNVKPGDLFKIVRTGTAVTYYRNGTLISLSPASTASTTLLMADASYTTANGTLTTVRTSFSTTSHSVIRRFEYDHAGRLINTWHQLDSNPEILLAKNEYNELGQLVDKKLHSTVATGANAKQSIDYRYNIRGWLTKLNESDLSIPQSGEARDLFGMQLLYNESDGISNTPLHNGNISGIKWSNNLSVGTVKENAYVYSYDPMNRIKTSGFKNKAASWTAASNNGTAETGFDYDLNSNIKTLQRNDQRVSGWMDNLTYTYSHATEGTSNKLRKVADSGDPYKGFVDGNNSTDEYTYDANGNMITDLNKGLSTAITYNFMNLPELVTKGANTINYIYDASGRKLAQVTNFGGIVKQTDYAGEYQYENDQLQHVAHEEGRIVIAKTETVYTNSAEVTTGMTASNATLANVTANGTEKYVSATSNGTVARTGIFPVKSLTVVAGETYLIRAKGYRTGANAAYLLIKAGGADQNWPGATLANGTTAEAWTEQTVTIPTGMTTLEAGVVWNTVTSGQQFFLNEFEIIKVSTNATPEYQYNLKDHLGNVRLTFTAKSQTDSYTATYEAATATATAEDANFSPSYDNVTFISTSLYNHTPGGTRSQRLSAANTNEIVGLAKSLSVMPGDTVSMQVFAKYFTPTTTNSNITAGTLATAIASGFGLSPASTGEALKAYTSINQMFTAGGMMIGPGEWEDDNAPKAYLNYILFDKDYFPYDMGWDQIDYGPNATHDELTLIAPIRQPGYIYVYLSNESNKIIDVYFDDLTITHKLGPVVQSNDYYAFGLNFNSYQRENTTTNSYLYNGKEKQDELDLGWLDYGARMYMADIGKWSAVDPISDAYESYSAYNYVLNNPIRFIDPNGMEVEDPDGLYKQHKSKLKKNMETLETSLKQFEGNEAVTTAISKLVGEYKDTFKELSDLEGSDQVYRVQNGDRAVTTYDKGSHAVVVNIGADQSVGVVSHELKHASQFENGKVSFDVDNQRSGVLNDIGDETAGYNRERIFGGGNAKIWSDNQTREFGKAMNPPAYQDLPSHPIDINSKEGKKLREQTIEAGRLGKSVQEAYIGWQKDYQKGQKKAEKR